jgi:peroxiredoxin
MKRLAIGDVAPDFALPGHDENPVRLSDMLRSGNVLLVFNLGFV